MAALNMDRLLQACVTQGASDIHISVGRPPVLRIDGRAADQFGRVADGAVVPGWRVGIGDGVAAADSGDHGQGRAIPQLRQCFLHVNSGRKNA